MNLYRMLEMARQVKLVWVRESFETAEVNPIRSVASPAKKRPYSFTFFPFSRARLIPPFL